MRDKGLQPERTALAWLRTLLTWCAVLALLLRSAWLSAEQPVTLWAVYFLAACTIPLAAVCMKRAQHLRLIHPPRQMASWIPLALSASCAISAVLALWSKLG